MTNQTSTTATSSKNESAKKSETKVSAKPEGLDSENAFLSVELQRATANPQTAKPAEILALQRRSGNRAVTQLIQTKLTVGPANDHYEQEADRVAAQVMAAPTSMPNVQRLEDEDEIQAKPLAASITPLIQRSAAPEETELQAKSIQRSGEEDDLQAKSMLKGESFSPGVNFERRLSSAHGGGKPLPKTTRDFMEQRFGADFSGVSIHTGSESAQLNREISAQAFTRGQDIYLGEGKEDMESSAGKQLLAHELTHVVQQNESIRTQSVQRHPNHAEEQEVLAKRIQRHPSHAEEQEVQAKREPAQIAVTSLPTQNKPIQRLTIGTDDKNKPLTYSVSDVMSKLKNDYKFVDTKVLKTEITGFHQSDRVFESWEALDTLLRSKKHPLKHQDKKIRLEAKYGIPLGGESGIEQFGETVLDKLDELFSLLPKAHLNALEGIKRQKEDTASFYDPETRTLTISYAQPAWLYSLGKKNTKLFGKDARALMEQAATPTMMEGSGYDLKKDKSLGLDTDKRATISYSRDDPFANTGIMEWTVLHEIGHAVDDRIKWTTRNGNKPEFGGWITHGEQRETEAQQVVAEAYLKDAGLSLEALSAIAISYDDEINKVIDANTKAKTMYEDKLKKAKNEQETSLYNKQIKSKEEIIEAERAKLGKTKTGSAVFMAAFLGTDLAAKKKAATEIASGVPLRLRSETETKLNQAFEKIAFAQAVPWQFPDGLASKLEVGGRIYQLDHYKTWVSYLAAARKNILSPYQFSSPGEWIAEAYAAFYGTNAAARNLLTPQTKTKIESELGTPPRKGVSEAVRAKGSFEGSNESGKPVLNEPKPEKIELISARIEEPPGQVEEGPADKEPQLVVGGPPSTSPLQEAIS